MNYLITQGIMSPNEVRSLQGDARLALDGIPGPMLDLALWKPLDDQRAMMILEHHRPPLLQGDTHEVAQAGFGGGMPRAMTVLA